MGNPILNRLNDSQNNTTQNNGSFWDKLFNNMMQSNPQFRDFVNANQGKTPEQIMQENNISQDQFNAAKRNFRL